MADKHVLVVDDSEIDREILINIIESKFKVSEASNGFSALKIVLDKSPAVDAILLDISMPVLDGFSVIELLKKNGIEDIPIILITAEPTKTNVQKAMIHNVNGFISKPFSSDDILKRLCTLFGMDGPAQKPKAEVSTISENDLNEMEAYISKLTTIYKRYLTNNNRSDEKYVRVSGLTGILLNEYAAFTRDNELDRSHINVITKASYFYDIGQMCIPDSLCGGVEKRHTSDAATYESHTVAGADLIWMNPSNACRYFVKVCADICMHHHERYDGKGYPHNLAGDDNSAFTLICSLAIDFDEMFFTRPEQGETQFNFVLHELKVDPGAYSSVMLRVLETCEDTILTYYKNYTAGK